MKSSGDMLMLGVILVMLIYMLYEYNKPSENMDARYFSYVNEKENKDENKQDIQESPTIYGDTLTPQKPTTTKCGNFISSDLLPKTSDVVEDKFQFAPNKDVKLLIKPTTSLIGVNTQGGSLRNPNLDIRSSPSIEKKEVSPWLNSTIGPDLFRRPLE